jgi:CDP-ribitol ribitolphosphotransferase
MQMIENPIIKKIDIERVFLKISIIDKIGYEYYIYSKSQNPIKLKKTKLDDDNYEIIINLTIVNKSNFLNNGSYNIGFYDTVAQDYHPFYISEDVAKNISDLDKIYKYGNNNYVYNISFDIYSKDDKVMYMKMYSYFYKLDNKWQKRVNPELKYLIGKKSKVKLIGKTLFFSSLQVIYNILCVFHRQRKMLIIYKFTNTLAGNLKILYEKLVEKYNKEKVLTQVSDGNSNKFTIKFYLKFVNKLAKAKYIFVDGPIPIFKDIKLSKKTKLIQLWHAGAGFKGAGFARFGIGNSIFPSNGSHRQVDSAMASSKALIDVFSEVFALDKKKFFIANMPRMEEFMQVENIVDIKSQVYKKFPQLLNKTVILFAPTYRGKVNKGYYPESAIEWDSLYKELGNDKVLIAKFHPNIRNKPDLSKYADKILDLSDTIEINPLFTVADLLITDYSSVYYEFGLFKKPMLFYCFDKYIYENTRGVYQRVDDSAPGKVVNNFNELVNAINSKDFEFQKTEQFYNDFFKDFIDTPSATDYIIEKFSI